jgi:hypothetical protein
MRAGIVVVVALLSLVGCAEVERGCTLIAALRGVGVTVEPGYAVSRLRLTVCVQPSSCREVPVQLAADTEPVDPTCSGTVPDDSCSVSMSPNGARSGFVEVPELASSPTTVAARFSRGGKTVSLPAVTVQPAMTYPNGPDCGGGAPQARVVIGTAGLRAG